MSDLVSHLRKPVEPVPPNEYLKRSDHHWLEVLDTDGHSFGLQVVQWNPGARRWTHSGAYGSGIYLNTECWRYVAHCPLPGTEESYTNEPLIRGWLFSAPGIVKIDVAPHGGDWKPLIYKADYEQLARELALLRNVYEAARQLVRFYGVDKEKSIAAGTALDNALEAVKNFDGGTDE